MILARILGTLYPITRDNMYVIFNKKPYFIHTDSKNNNKYIVTEDGSKLNITEFETL